MIAQSAYTYVSQIIAAQQGITIPPPPPARRSFGFPHALHEDTNIVLTIHPALSQGQFPEFIHSHDMYELTYVYRGNFHQVIRELPVLQPQSSLLLLNIGAAHRVWVEHPEDIVINLLIRRERMQHLFLDAFRKNTLIADFLADRIENAYLLFPGSARIVEAMDEIIVEHFERKPFSDYMMQSLLIKLLTEATRAYTPQGNKKKQSRGETLMRIQEYIDKNYSTIKLQALAERFDYSYRQMERIVRKIYCMPFPDVINIKRLRALDECLRHDMPLSDALETVGFASSTHYRKTLIHLEGKYPDIRAKLS